MDFWYPAQTKLGQCSAISYFPLFFCQMIIKGGSLHKQHTDDFHCSFLSWVHVCLISGSFPILVWLVFATRFDFEYFNKLFMKFQFIYRLKKVTALSNDNGNDSSSNDSNSFMPTKLDKRARRGCWKSNPRSHFILMSVSSVVLVVILWACDIQEHS